MTTDLSDYAQLLENARSLFESLKEVRKQIKEHERFMIDSLNGTTTPSGTHIPIPVIVNQRPGHLRVVGRSRRLPLTVKTLTEEVGKYVQEKFGGPNSSNDNIIGLANDIGHKIWTDRQTKKDFKLSLRLD
jgi:hypothetical protein